MNQAQQLEVAVFERALQLPVDQRASYLEAACRGDAGLRRRVEDLLGAFGRAGGFMRQAAVPDPAVAFRVPSEKPGDKIGRYKLLEQIGEGGCGIVYVAEQQEPVRRRVALKVIKLGMDTKQVIARFDAERQALAMMDHPNIAKVLDAGATETGRPYFVMELVRGVKLTEYCDQNRLPHRERLELFVQVCHAIQHAHQKGIIHRDIKPSNILVTVNDGIAVPKVIDFGIAKATQGRLTDHTVYTAFEQFVGTPAYMSPEQAVMTSLDVDTRSDIYSLGVLLYELLTGKTPFEAKELLSSGLDAMRRTICKVQPVKPSTRMTQELAATHGRRRTAKSEIRKSESEMESASSPRRLQELIHVLRGDLDWIVMKCLEKDRARRYETANALGADIRHHLANEPVLARPPSGLYRFQKSVQRNKAAFAATFVVSVVLAGGVAAVTWEAIRAARAEREQFDLRRRAEKAGETARQQEQLAIESAEKASQHQHIAEEQALLARRRFYAAQMNLASQAIETGQWARALELLEAQRPSLAKEDLRTFEWYHLWGRCNARLRLTLQNGEPVTGLAFSRNGTMLASSGEGGQVRLWELPEGKAKLTLKTQSQARVTAVEFSPDGETLVSGGWDGMVRLWNVPTGKLRVALAAHPNMVRTMALSPDGKCLATCGDEGVKLWDMALKKELDTLLAGQAPALGLGFSADGATLASVSGWGSSNAIALWDLTRNPPQAKVQMPGGRLIALSRDGRYVATARWKDIELLDAATGRLLTTVTGHLPVMAALAFLPDGRTLASCSTDRTIRLWTPLEREEGEIIGAHPEPVACLAVSTREVRAANSLSMAWAVGWGCAN